MPVTMFHHTNAGEGEWPPARLKAHLDAAGLHGRYCAAEDAASDALIRDRRASSWWWAVTAPWRGRRDRVGRDRMRLRGRRPSAGRRLRAAEHLGRRRGAVLAEAAGGNIHTRHGDAWEPFDGFGATPDRSWRQSLVIGDEAAAATCYRAF
jgi:hypothetical protein